MPERSADVPWFRPTRPLLMPFCRWIAWNMFSYARTWRSASFLSTLWAGFVSRAAAGKGRVLRFVPALTLKVPHSVL